MNKQFTEPQQEFLTWFTHVYQAQARNLQVQPVSLADYFSKPRTEDDRCSTDNWDEFHTQLLTLFNYKVPVIWIHTQIDDVPCPRIEVISPNEDIPDKDLGPVKNYIYLDGPFTRTISIMFWFD